MDDKQAWFIIPRPSLSSNSSSNTSKSHHDSIRCYHRDSEVINKTKKGFGKLTPATTSSSSSSVSSNRSKGQVQRETCVDGEGETPKRGSRSSQGSSDSEQSIHVRRRTFLKVLQLKPDSFHSKSLSTFSAERLIAAADRREFRKLCQNSGTIARHPRVIRHRQYCENA